MNNIFERSIWSGANAERLAFTPDLTGTVFFETDTGDAYWWDGAAWQAMGGGGGGADPNAIHDNVAAEISAIANKATPIGDDMAVIEDSAAADAKKMIYLQSMFIKIVNFQVYGQIPAAIDSIGLKRIYNTLGRTMTIEEVEISVGSPPTGQAIIVDINKGGVTIFTNQAHRPQIAAGAYVGTTTDIDVNSWADGEYFTMDIDQAGSILPGGYLVCNIRVRLT